MATTAHRVDVPSGNPVYNGTGKPLDDAVKDAHDKIPRHRQGHGFNEAVKPLRARKTCVKHKMQILFGIVARSGRW
jgi:hypothetical protein